MNKFYLYINNYYNTNILQFLVNYTNYNIVRMQQYF